MKVMKCLVWMLALYAADMYFDSDRRKKIMEKNGKDQLA